MQDVQMQIITATDTVAEVGPLAKIVNGFSQVHGKLVDAGISSISEWEPLAQFVAVDEFKRVGAYLEEFNWTEYLQFLTDWAGDALRDDDVPPDRGGERRDPGDRGGPLPG